MLKEILEKLYQIPATESRRTFPKEQFFVSLNRKVVLPRQGNARFIVFEGLDGSGQSTQASLIRDHLEEKGIDILLTKEPTSLSEYGKKAQSAINKEMAFSPNELQELFAKDRREHVNRVIVPALKEGRTVICDRYFFSSFAYGSLDCDFKWLIGLNGDFLFPDKTFILAVDPKICIERLRKRGSRIQIFEEYDKLAKVLEMYRRLSRMFDDVYFVNGEQSLESVFYTILLNIFKKESVSKV